MKKFGGNTKSGFTLIELLVVVFIIGVLATAVSVSLMNSQSKSRDAKRKADINSLKTAIGQYYEDNGSYPELDGIAADRHMYLNKLNPETMTDLKPYLSTIPVDPKLYKLGWTYHYAKLDLPQAAYAVTVLFENTEVWSCYPGVEAVGVRGLCGCKTGANENLVSTGFYSVCKY